MGADVNLATTRGALLRGVTHDDLGDEVASETPVDGFEDFALSLIEVDEDAFDQASNTWRAVTRLVGRVPTNVPINEGDRIKDLRDGAIYALEEFRRTPRGLSGRSSVTMTLKRTSP